MTDVLENLTDAVTDLDLQLDYLLDACTDPAGTDVAELLDLIRTQRVALQALEGRAEESAAKALLDDMTTTDTLRIERHRTTDRKAWQHAEWQRDVRAKVMQAAGLKGCHLVLPTGELLDGKAATDVLYTLMSTLQAAHGSAAPKTTALRALGLDARDYCESSPGRWTVRVTRMADETEEGAA